MRKLLFFIGFSVISVTLTAQEFKFEMETIDYGKVQKNSNGTRTFVFTNVGDQPLIIKNIQSSCGCTVPKRLEKPIMPGEKGEIEVSHNTAIVSRFAKNIMIYSNAKQPKKQLRIKGSVYDGISLEKEKSILSEPNN